VTEEPFAARLLRVLTRAEQSLGIAAFSALTLILVADVVSRELTGAGLVWARQLGAYANVLLTMAGIGLASAAGGHLRPRFADAWLPRELDPVIVRLQEAVTAIACAIFATVAALAIRDTWLLAERTSTPDLPIWPFQLAIPLAFALTAVRHACHAVWPALRPASPAGDTD